jgi:hypothetical protein
MIQPVEKRENYLREKRNGLSEYKIDVILRLGINDVNGEMCERRVYFQKECE